MHRRFVELHICAWLLLTGSGELLELETYGPYGFVKTNFLDKDIILNREIFEENDDSASEFKFAEGGLASKTPGCQGQKGGKVGPPSVVSFNQQVSEHIGIPRAAQLYVFVYTDTLDEDFATVKAKTGNNPDALFCLRGGYIYLDGNYKIVEPNGVFTREWQHEGSLVYHGPLKWNPAWTARFRKLGRIWDWHKASTHKEKSFLWIRPNEEPVAHALGGIAFFREDPDDTPTYWQMLTPDQIRIMNKSENRGTAAFVFTCMVVFLTGSAIFFMGRREKAIRDDYMMKLREFGSKDCQDVKSNPYQDANSMDGPPQFTKTPSTRPQKQVCIEMAALR